jgi:hypothetical protein
MYSFIRQLIPINKQNWELVHLHLIISLLNQIYLNLAKDISVELAKLLPVYERQVSHWLGTFTIAMIFIWRVNMDIAFYSWDLISMLVSHLHITFFIS